MCASVDSDNSQVCLFVGVGVSLQAQVIFFKEALDSFLEEMVTLKIHGALSGAFIVTYNVLHTVKHT